MLVNDKILRQALVSVNSTIKDVIKNLDQVGIKIVLIVNEKNELQGTVSDGDVRRGLLKHLDLNSHIETIIQRDAIVAPPGLGHKMVSQLMATNQVLQIPVVDEHSHVVGLHLADIIWDEVNISPSRSNLMVIMAGGKGTRLLPYTKKTPKPLVKMAGKPMLEHIIEQAKLEGFVNFVISIFHLGDMIEDYFGNGDSLDVKIDYLREQSPLGTAGALSLFNPPPNAPFVMTNGDVMTDIRYGEMLDFHIRNEAAATMAVRVYEQQNPFGVVQIEGIEIVGFEEKPLARSHINAGVYAFSPEVLGELAGATHCDIPDLFEKLQAKAKRIVAYPMHEPWLDVGRPDDLNLNSEVTED